MDKGEMLKYYIERAEKAFSEKDKETAKSLIAEIVAVYENEIPGIAKGLDTYSNFAFYDQRPADSLTDIHILGKKLENYYNNLRTGLYKELLPGKGVSITQMQNATQSTETVVAVSLEQTIENINSLPDSSLTAEEKEILSGKLAAISAEKDKNKKWEKAKNALKWIAEKGIEVGIAALPYIAGALGI